MKSEELEVLLRRDTRRYEGRWMRQGLASASSGAAAFRSPAAVG